MNGIDRVFVSALNTVKRLPSTPGSPKPPLDDRLLLYALFKQSTEGDIPASMLESLEASLRNGEDPEDDDASREKTEAWALQRGLSKTEAKKMYISSLIRSMRLYGSQTTAAKALIDELEFVWLQVDGNAPEHEDDQTVASRARTNSGSQSPTSVRLKRAYESSQRLNRDAEGEDEDEHEDELERQAPNAYRTAPPSPVKAGLPNSASVTFSASQIPALNLAAPQPLPNSKSFGTLRAQAAIAGRDLTPEETKIWRRQVEISLQQIRTELASVRETLLHVPAAGMLSRSHGSGSTLSRVLASLSDFARLSAVVLIYDAIFLGSLWFIFSRNGDPRALKIKDWCGRLWAWMLKKVKVRMRSAVRDIGDRR
ncbi:acyl CoA binding protein-domain-containing protein [Protomyces lactucae-debilis]|uniref:Acyl CoA binding protein-domain-containing protein n=1 Tax=Protomyces lactucae-debilis TaxID=2754530 RepID=A0A1Y2ERY0_PROLT|nr:acyl CoA binding protein-domain-containing protein [Protomyces lactucae-debilis]ORY74351.1 acyl CoA binding protein-domain-containing protein [Protomyces lactucae-debilis]